MIFAVAIIGCTIFYCICHKTFFKIPQSGNRSLFGIGCREETIIESIVCGAV